MNAPTTHQPPPRTRRWPLWLGLILLLAFGLRLAGIERESIWHDEGWSIRAIRAPFTDPDDNTPFAYYLLMHGLWRIGAGESALALRYGSVLLGVIGVAAGMALARRWYGNIVALAAGLLLALNPLLWAYAREVRAYILVPLLAIALLWALERWLFPPRLLTSASGDSLRLPLTTGWRGRWGVRFTAWPLPLIATLEVIALYTHNLGVPLVAWASVTAALILLWRRDWRGLMAWIIAQALVGLLYIPWLLTQTPSGTPLNTPPRIGLTLVRDIWYSYFLPVLGQLRGAENVLLDALGILTIIIIAFALIRRIVPLIPPLYLVERGLGGEVKPRHGVSLQTPVPPPYEVGRGLGGGDAFPHFAFLLSQTILLPAFTVALILAAHIDFHPRYFIAAVPATLILIAAIYQLPATSYRLPALFLLITTITISALSIHAINTTRAYQHDDFAGLAAYYADLPADSVILMPFGTEPALQTYFAGRLGITARFVNLPLYSDESAAIAAINQLIAEGVKQVEFVTWFQLPADERGMYPCLLTAASSHVDEPRTFYGLMTQRYTLEKSLDFAALDAQPRYANAALDESMYRSSTAGICLRTTWTGTGNSAQVQAALFNPLGAEIARVDASIAPADPLNPRDFSAYHVLHLPEAAPELDYELGLTLYDAIQPSGYDLLTESGNPAGKMYRLPEAVHAAGSPYTGDAAALPLLLDDGTNGTFKLESGGALDVTVLVPGGLENADLRVEGSTWGTAYGVNSPDDPLLTWTRFRTQPGTSGQLTLYLDQTELARYELVNVPRIFEQPYFDRPIGVEFPGVGTLEGVFITPDGEALQVALVWKAAQPTQASYTVFVQAFDADGNMLAQSDRMPVEDTRPTTSWVSGEYLVDQHRLTFPAGSAPAYLIAGFYDAAAPGFPRLPTSTNDDHATIPLNP